MTAVAVGRAYALTRVGAGLALVVAPALGGRLLGDTTARHSVRLMGVRDALLGIDALLAAPESPSWRRSMALCAVADAADAVVSAGRIRRGEPVALVVAMTAAAGAATGWWAARSRSPG